MYLYQEQDGFLFNSDAHFLYDFIAKFTPRGNLLDVGCGCGIVGLLVARDFDVDLTMVDLQPHNVFLARQNARVNAIEAEVIEADILTYDFEKRFDYIIANPPYYREGADISPKDRVAISKHASYMPLGAMVERLNRIITPRGHLLFCYEAGALPAVADILTQKRFPITDLRFVHGTPEKPAKLVLVHAQKGSRAQTRIHPPLIHFEGERMHAEAASIYQKTRTYSIKCSIS